MIFILLIIPTIKEQSMSIDIGGIDKVKLLRKLWDNQIRAAFFTMNGIPSLPFDESGAAKAITAGYIDYYAGRAIKSNLSGDTANTAMYDRDAGKGKFAQIVSSLR